MTETYVGLSRQRDAPMGPAEVAAQVLDKLASRIESEPLLRVDYQRAISEAADVALVNAAIYDLLHCVCADRLGADELWTLNARDFRRFEGVTAARMLYL